MGQEERRLVFSEMREAATRARRARDEMPETLTLEIDLSDTQNLLHVLRNPYGWGENTARAARLVAANYIEALLKQPKDRLCAKDEAIDALTRFQEEMDALRQRAERAEKEKEAVVDQLKRLKQEILAKICD